MMYSELLSLTDGKATYAQFLEIEAAYMARENMTKQQAARLWNRRYGEKILKPLAKELREIKQAIRDFQREKQWAERDEKQISEKYAEKTTSFGKKQHYLTKKVLMMEIGHPIGLQSNPGNAEIVHTQG